MGYALLKNQPNRLGEFAGEAADIAATIGSTATAITQAITGSKVAIQQSRDTRIMATTEATESTKKLGIQGKTQVDLAREDVNKAKAKYITIPIVIAVSGATLIGAIAVGAWAYNKMVGEYEIEYQ